MPSSTQSATKKSPLHEQHVEVGAKLVPFAGWEMPIEFDGIKEEHLAVRSHVGMFDVSHMGEVEVEGPQAAGFLQYALSNDIEKLSDGKSQYSLLCTEAGGIIDDLFVYRLARDHFLIVTNASNHGSDLSALGERSRGFDCVVRDVADRWAMIAVQGPNARATVVDSLNVELPPRLGIRPDRVGGAPGMVCGTGYTGEDGVELIVDPGRAPAVWGKLLDSGVVPCGLGARDSLRLEACFHLHGNDISTETNPVEAGLGWASKEETGFVGSEAIAGIRASGTQRILVPFEVVGKGIARQGNPVVADEEEVGVVTSGGHSPSLGMGVGFAYVNRELSEPGTEIDIDVRGRVRQARVARKPLYRKD